MDTLTITLRFPRDLLGALEVPPEQLETRLRELIALQLFQEGRISSGKGAELLGLSKLDFIKLLARHGLAYFTESPEELIAEIETLERLLGRGNKREGKA